MRWVPNRYQSWFWLTGGGNHSYIKGKERPVSASHLERRKASFLAGSRSSATICGSVFSGLAHPALDAERPETISWQLHAAVSTRSLRSAGSNTQYRDVRWRPEQNIPIRHLCGRRQHVARSLHTAADAWTHTWGCDAKAAYRPVARFKQWPMRKRYGPQVAQAVGCDTADAAASLTRQEGYGSCLRRTRDVHGIATVVRSQTWMVASLSPTSHSN